MGLEVGGCRWLVVVLLVMRAVDILTVGGVSRASRVTSIGFLDFL